MFGPVSLSNTYNDLSKDLIIHYYTHYYGNFENLVTPKFPFNFLRDRESLDKLFEYKSAKEDFKILKSLLGELNLSIPTLYKQYTDITEEFGSEFLGFNIDVDFGNCVDGFIFVHIDKIKEKQKQRYIK